MSKIPPGARELIFYTYFTNEGLKEYAKIPGGPKSKWTVITMGKKSVTIYIEDELIDEARNRNYNISFLVNETLKLYLNENFNEIEIAARLSAIDAILLDMKVDVNRRQLEYQAAVDKYDRLLKRRNNMEEEFMEAQRTLRLSRIIRELNSIIIACDFDIKVIEESCNELTRRISELSPYFNLEKHVARLKNTLL